MLSTCCLIFLHWSKKKQQFSSSCIWVSTLIITFFDVDPLRQHRWERFGCLADAVLSVPTSAASCQQMFLPQNCLLQRLGKGGKYNLGKNPPNLAAMGWLGWAQKSPLKTNQRCRGWRLCMWPWEQQSCKKNRTITQGELQDVRALRQSDLQFGSRQSELRTDR